MCLLGKAVTPILGTVLGLVLSLPAAAPAAAAPEKEEKSPVRRLGKTVVEWKDGTIQVVMSYRWANSSYQKERWLFFETGVMAMSGKPVTVAREDVSLVLPDGTSIPMPSQKTMGEDNREVVRQLNTARASRDPITGYFVGADREERMGFFTVPGANIVFQEFNVDFRRVALGDIFFTTPTGLWKPGTYRLVIRNKDVSVSLPFDLPAGELKKDGDKGVTW